MARVVGGISDVEKVLVLAMKGTFMEEIGAAVERVLADGRFVVNNGADLDEIVTRHSAVWFHNPEDAPERDLASAIGKAFGAYYDAKTKAAKEAAEAQAKRDAEAPAIAAKAAQDKAEASKRFAENSKKAAEEANKVAATDAQRAAAVALTAAADAAQKQALKDQMDAELAKSAAANAAKYPKGPTSSLVVAAAKAQDDADKAAAKAKANPGDQGLADRAKQAQVDADKANAAATPPAPPAAVTTPKPS